MATTRRTILISPRVHRRLKMLSAKADIDLQQLIDHALREWLAQQRLVSASLPPEAPHAR